MNEIKPPETEIKPFVIASFWRRFLAFIIDGAIFSIPLIILGFMFSDIAFSLGPWGRPIGYGLLLVYWGYFNSIYGNGQTLGKALMKIAVVDSEGHYLSISKSMLRAFILAIIGLLNNWAMRFMANPIMSVIATTIILGGGLALIYGLVFNWKTRQGIHDLLVGSYVVQIPLEADAIPPLRPHIHTIISYSLVGAGLILGLLVISFANNKPTMGILEPGEWDEIEELQTTLSANNEYFSVTVQRNNRLNLSNSSTLKDLNIEVWAKKSCSQDPKYCNKVIKEVAQTAFKQYNGIEKLSGMRILVINAFDLGLAKGNYWQREEWSMDDWRKKLAQ